MWLWSKETQLPTQVEPPARAESVRKGGSCGTCSSGKRKVFMQNTVFKIWLWVKKGYPKTLLVGKMNKNQWSLLYFLTSHIPKLVFDGSGGPRQSGNWVRTCIHPVERSRTFRLFRRVLFGLRTSLRPVAPRRRI